MLTTHITGMVAVSRKIRRTAAGRKAQQPALPVRIDVKRIKIKRKSIGNYAKNKF